MLPTSNDVIGFVADSLCRHYSRRAKKGRQPRRRVFGGGPAGEIGLQCVRPRRQGPRGLRYSSADWAKGAGIPYHVSEGQ